jgi:hypothetical protein
VGVLTERRSSQTLYRPPVRAGSFLEDPPGSHDERDPVQCRGVGERVAVEGDDLGLRAFRDRPDAVGQPKLERPGVRRYTSTRTLKPPKDMRLT